MKFFFNPPHSGSLPSGEIGLGYSLADPFPQGARELVSTYAQTSKSCRSIGNINALFPRSPRVSTGRQAELNPALRRIAGPNRSARAAESPLAKAIFRPILTAGPCAALLPQ